MKYLKLYNLFKESDEFEVTDSDAPDVIMSKEKLTLLKSQLTDYNSKKTAIDNIYKADFVREDELKKIIGEKGKENPFLLSYANVVGVKRKIQDLQKKDDKKAIELSEFKDRLSIATNDLKTPLSKRISEIQSEQSTIKADIQTNIKSFSELEKEHNLKMKNIENDMKLWIQKL